MLKNLEAAIKKSLLSHHETLDFHHHSTRVALDVFPVTQKSIDIDAERKIRDQAIYEMYNGRNREQVMQHFKISRRLFYAILARVRASKVVRI